MRLFVGLVERKVAGQEVAVGAFELAQVLIGGRPPIALQLTMPQLRGDQLQG